jgi:hypothetical protein
MRIQSYYEEAEACRRSAEFFFGKPEASFLLQVASSFEELAERQHQSGLSATNLEARDPVSRGT